MGAQILGAPSRGDGRAILGSPNTFVNCVIAVPLAEWNARARRRRATNEGKSRACRSHPLPMDFVYETVLSIIANVTLELYYWN